MPMFPAWKKTCTSLDLTITCCRPSSLLVMLLAKCLPKWFWREVCHSLTYAYLNSLLLTCLFKFARHTGFQHANCSGQSSHSALQQSVIRETFSLFVLLWDSWRALLQSVSWRLWVAGTRLVVCSIHSIKDPPRGLGTIADNYNRTLQTNCHLLLGLLCGQHVQRLSPSRYLQRYGRTLRSGRMALALHFLRHHLASIQRVRLHRHPRQPLQQQSVLDVPHATRFCTQAHGSIWQTPTCDAHLGQNETHSYSLASLCIHSNHDLPVSRHSTTQLFRRVASGPQPVFRVSNKRHPYSRPGCGSHYHAGI